MQRFFWACCLDAITIVLSLESKVQFEVIQPWNARIDAFGLQAAGEVFVVRSELVSVGRVVVRDNNGVTVHSHVPVEPLQQVFGQVGSVPLCHGVTDPPTQLVQHGLGHQSQCHLPVSDVKVQSSSALPAEFLIRVEELFNMPSLRILVRQGFDFIAVAGGQVGAEAPHLGCFSRTLHELVVSGWALGQAVGKFTRSEAGPTWNELFGGDGLELPLERTGVGHGDEELEVGLAMNLVDQLGGEVFGIGEDQGLAGFGLKDPRGHVE